MKSKRLLLLFPTILGALALFRGIFLNGVIVDVDFLFQQIPFRSFAHNEIIAGRLPFVYPYSLLGIPLMAHGQIGVFFPLTFVSLLLKNQFIAYYFELIVLFVLGFAGEYLFSSLYFKDRTERILASLYFAFSPFVFIHIIHLNLLVPFMLLPYSLYFVKKAEEDRKNVFVLTLIFAFGFLSFHPQAAMICVVITFIYALFLPDRTKRLSKAFVALFIGVILAGVQVVPFLLLRASGEFVSHKGLSWMAQGSFDPFLSGALFFIPLPYYRTPVHNTPLNGEIYLYITGFLGLLSYIFSKRWKEGQKELLLISILGLFLMMVKYNPLYLLLSKVPVLNSVRGHIRWWGGILPFVSIMMVMGLRELEKGSLKKGLLRLSLLPFIWILYFVFVKLAASDKWFYLFNIRDKSNFATFFLWAILFLLFFIIRRRKKLFVTFLSLEILVFANLLYPYARKSMVMKIMRDFESYRNTRFASVALDLEELNRIFNKSNSEILQNFVLFGTFFHGNFSYFLPAYNVLGYVAPQLEPEYAKNIREVIYQGFYLNENTEQACRELELLDIDYLMTFTPVLDTSCVSLKEVKHGMYIYSVLNYEKHAMLFKDGDYLVYNRSGDSIVGVPLRYIPGLHVNDGEKPLKFRSVSDHVIEVYANGSKRIIIKYRPWWVYYGMVVSLTGIVLFVLAFTLRRKDE